MPDHHHIANQIPQFTIYSYTHITTYSHTHTNMLYDYLFLLYPFIALLAYIYAGKTTITIVVYTNPISDIQLQMNMDLQMRREIVDAEAIALQEQQELLDQQHIMLEWTIRHHVREIIHEQEQILREFANQLNHHRPWHGSELEGSETEADE